MKMKKIISLILVIVLTLSMVCALNGCKKKADNNNILIYYTNNTADELIYKSTKINTKDIETIDLIQVLLDKMFNSKLEEKSYYSVKPNDVEINSITFKDGVVSIDFNYEYLKMTNVREIIFRAGVVLTLIQAPNVTGVIFTVENVPITNNSNEPIGMMTKDVFVNVLLNDEGMLKQTTELKVYFANEDNTKLVSVPYIFSIDNSSVSMEEYLITKLIEGPQANTEANNKDSVIDITKINPTLNPNVTLISVVTTEGICYINFGADFLEQHLQISDELMIYSIVNTVCQLPYVSSVQFLIEGKKDVKLHKTISFAEKFKYNSKYIQ